MSIIKKIYIGQWIRIKREKGFDLDYKMTTPYKDGRFSDYWTIINERKYIDLLPIKCNGIFISGYEYSKSERISNIRLLSAIGEELFISFGKKEYITERDDCVVFLINNFKLKLANVTHESGLISWHQ